MKLFVNPSFLLLGIVSCASPSSPELLSQAPGKSQSSDSAEIKRQALPRTFWPLDYTTQKSTKLLPGREQYCVQIVTTCLNDSAVINPITVEAGPALDVSHNYQSDISITKAQHPWLHARLTKALFLNDTVARAFGSFQELALSRTAFLNHQHGEFRFYTRLGVPDSDVFMEAEVALAPKQGLRVVSVKPQVWNE